MPSFDIILTTFNRLEYTRRTIASLIESGAHGACQRFIIVDNHSTEEGMETFLNHMAYYRKVFVLRRPSNDGWGTAVNDALGLSRAEFILLSNNDVEYKQDFYKEMFETYQQLPRIGILGVWRHTSHGFVPQHMGGIQTEWFKEMDDVPAVGWLMPKKAMEVVGMLSEHGPCATKGGNGEDTDYVDRMRAAGFLIGVPPTDVATHLDGY